MASAIMEYTNPQASPTRMPKLSYRTQSYDTMSVSSASTRFTNSTASAASTTPTSPLCSDFCPSPRSPPSEMSLPASPRRPSVASASTKSSPLPKKRSNFFSDIFSVKEPSAQALQDYQRQLMKQGGGRVTAVGMPGVSSAKLPATVPKVNSKWDGVPQANKLKEKDHDTKRQSLSGLSRQLGTSRSGASDHSAPSTPDSSGERLSRGAHDGVSMRSGGRNNLAELYGWETNGPHSGSSNINFSTEHRPTTSRSTASLQKSSSSSPSHPSRPPAIQFPPMQPSPSKYMDSPMPPSLTNSPALTPYESSPATPDVSLPCLSLASPKLAESPPVKMETTLLEVAGSAEKVIVKSTGVNILGPPVAAKRKPRPIILPDGEERSKTSGADFPSSATLRREPPVPKDTSSARPPPSSYFPHTINTPSPRSPAKLPVRIISKHERQAIAPWLAPEQSTHVKVKGERIITPTPESTKSLKRKVPKTLFKK